MNTAQTQLYLRTWNSAWKTNWKMHLGAIHLLPNACRSQWVDNVEMMAGFIAQKQHRAPKQDDIRHAVHVVALGKDKSSKDLTNREFDRVLCLLRLLIDPDNLEEVIRWENPDLDERKRLVWFIDNFPAQYVRQIASDKFKQPGLDQLSMAQLRMLATTLRNRAPKPPANHARVPTVGVYEENPF